MLPWLLTNHPITREPSVSPRAAVACAILSWLQVIKTVSPTSPNYPAFSLICFRGKNSKEDFFQTLKKMLAGY